MRQWLCRWCWVNWVNHPDDQCPQCEKEEDELNEAEQLPMEEENAGKMAEEA